MKIETHLFIYLKDRKHVLLDVKEQAYQKSDHLRNSRSFKKLTLKTGHIELYSPRNGIREIIAAQNNKRNLITPQIALYPGSSKYSELI